MRKLLMSLSVLAGMFFAGTLPASANAAAGLTSIQVQKPAADATKVHWRGGWGGGGWGWGGPRLYLGFGGPWYGGYGYGYRPRYAYYDDYSYGYPRYYGWRRHHYWGHRHWRRW